MTQEITIQLIEDHLNKHRASWAEGATLRDIAIVFSILHVGNSVPRLVAFTGYEREFVYDLIHELTRNRVLLTGLPSRQFCFMQCAAAGELYDLLTGNSQVIQPRHTINKEISMSEKCRRSEDCTKELRHKGRCSTKVRSISSEDFTEAEAVVAPQPIVTVANASSDLRFQFSPPATAKFSIIYEEGENKISWHGIGRDRFLSSFNSVQQLLQEVSA